MNTQGIGRRNLSALYLYTALARLSFSGAVWVIYLQHRGVSLGVIGLLEAWFHICALTSDIPAGVFADRFGRKNSLLASSLFGMLSAVTFLLGNSVWLFAIGFLFSALSYSFSGGADASIAYESAVLSGQEANYRTIAGRLYAAMLIGTSVGTLAGGALASVAWPLVYAGDGIAKLLSMPAVSMIVEPLSQSENEKQIRLSALVIVREALTFIRSNSGFLRLLLFSTVLSGFTSLFGYYGQPMLQSAGWPIWAIGILSMVRDGGSTLASLAVGRLSQRLGDVKVLLISAGIVVGGLIMFAWGETQRGVAGTVIASGFVMTGVAVSFADPIFSHYLNNIVPSDSRATLLSASSTSFSLFMIIFFPIFGFTAEYFSLSVATLFAVIIGVACISIATRLLISGKVVVVPSE